MEMVTTLSPFLTSTGVESGVQTAEGPRLVVDSKTNPVAVVGQAGTMPVVLRVPMVRSSPAFAFISHFMASDFWGSPNNRAMSRSLSLIQIRRHPTSGFLCRRVAATLHERVQWAGACGRE